MPRKSNRSKLPRSGNAVAKKAGDGPAYLVVARVRRPFGVKGELLLEILTDFPNRLAQHGRLYAGEGRAAYAVDSLRRHGKDMLLQLTGVEDRDAAERLRGAVLSVRVDDLPPLPAGSYYYHQIEGMEVFTEQGERLGKIQEILKTGANDVYVVQGTVGEILLPAIRQVIREVRVEEKKMVVRLLEGLV